MRTNIYKAEFLKVFRNLSQRYSSWTIWQDFISLSALSIANAVDRRVDIWESRESEYCGIMKSYPNDVQHEFINLFIITVKALDTNPSQDFLGDLFMELNLSNHWKGQFFTPWDISVVMAKLSANEDDIKKRIEKQYYISVLDPACGAGCTLLAFADILRNDYNVNYQRSVFFVGQDIDPIVAKMCYIQMSLLGCPGYVVVGNTLTEPVGGTLLRPQYERPECLWFTPLYFETTWALRRVIEETMCVMNPAKNADPICIKNESMVTELRNMSDEIEAYTSRKPNRKPNTFSWKEFFKRHD